MVTLLGAGAILLELLGIIVLVIYIFYQYKFQYWKSRNIPSVSPSFPFGNIGQVNFVKTFGEVFRDIYEENKHLPYVGIHMFFRPVLCVNDPELIKQIFVKEFNSFQDRGAFHNEERDPLSANLFAIGGAKWRYLRAKLSPTLTSGKMKMMFHILVEKTEKLLKMLEEPAKRGDSVDVKEIIAQLTTDIISSCAFGVEANSMSDPNSEFRAAGKRFFNMSLFEGVARLMCLICAPTAELLKLRFVPSEVEKFFMCALRETTEYRTKNEIERKDFLQLLMELQNKGYVEDEENEKDLQIHDGNSEKFTFNEIAAQAFAFFIGGFESSSTVSQLTLYELALQPDIQDRLREEVVRVKKAYNGKITYESIQEMTFLECCMHETMRKYPPPILQRECNKNYQIPETEHVIEKGTMVVVPSAGMNGDPNYFSQPERFDPERFNKINKNKIPQYVYMPFGEGPRNCIGMRFGYMQTKMILASLLSKYRFDICKETPVPMKLDPKNFVPSPEGGKMVLKISNN